MTDIPEVQLVGIEKRFGAVTALNGVDLDLRRGEVHALLGENGAGKTTLMNVASGILRPDAGRIVVRGEAVRIASPADAFEHGIGMVHQNHRLVAHMTVAENLHVGWRATPALISTAELRTRAAELSEKFGFDANPAARIAELSVGERQRVAILRTLARGARTLVLDEPTAVLTPQESESLFEIMRAMAAAGDTVVFISHKLAEVVAVADRISVLRGGQHVATLNRGEADVHDLARLMVGHEVDSHVSRERRAGPAGDPVLVATGVSLATDGESCGLREVDLEVRPGEIVGVAGVAGNGQTELADVLTGIRKPTTGTITVDGRDVEEPAEFIDAGVGHLPEDQRVGMLFGHSLTMNAVLKAVTQSDYRRGPFLLRSRLRALATRLISAAGLERISSGRVVATLSGGQAQRLLAQREILAGKRFLVAAQPCRGLDVAATEYVRKAIASACEDGIGVVLISEDLDEVLMLSDRVIVMYGGRVAGEVPRSEFDRHRIGLLMSGASAHANGGSARTAAAEAVAE